MIQKWHIATQYTYLKFRKGKFNDISIEVSSLFLCFLTEYMLVQHQVTVCRKEIQRMLTMNLGNGTRFERVTHS
jgi:hypothetical protein